MTVTLYDNFSSISFTCVTLTCILFEFFFSVSERLNIPSKNLALASDENQVSVCFL